MARITLKQVLGAGSPTHPVMAALAAAIGAPVSVEDAAGRQLYGAALEGTRFPVIHDGCSLGWVTGPERAESIADLLRLLVEKEAERKSLGTEVLQLYREVNLIYSFSEKLAALLDLDRVAHLTLQEARHLIVATDGAILLLDEATGMLTPVAVFGDEFPRLPGLVRGHGIIGAVVASGVGEIVDDITADPRRVAAVDLQSLVCAPLKVGEKVIGAIALASTLRMAYEARELKLLNTLALQTATAIENARLFERTVQAGVERERLLALNKEAEVARAGFERELDLAARIQADLFPLELPAIPGYEVAAKNRPARRCGGDYYDALTASGVQGTDVLFCVADVSGKGLPASLLMSHMQATLRALLGRTASLPELADCANLLLHGSTAGNKYVTAALLELDPATGAARYVSAGHIDSWVFGCDGSAPRPLASTGAPLGLLPGGASYEQTLLDIAPGDCVVICSDGVTDAQNEAEEEFGEERFKQAVRSVIDCPVRAIVDHVFSAIDTFAGTAPQFDDITLLVVRRSIAS
jgi:serine phosphatase RsbU (regulator of sigma subunit)